MVIGLLGYGVVGKGFYKILSERKDMIVKRIFGRRIYAGVENKCTLDINDIMNDDEIDTVVEVIGGDETAFTYIKMALENKKNVVTANKQLIIAHYAELIPLAEKNGVFLRYSAAVGGGVPWLTSLERAHRISRVYEIYGIMNGTTNFILDEMTEFGSDFDIVLKAAQEKGFAERDPSADIDGLDVRRKIAISANVAFGVIIKEDDVDCFGIRNIKKCDIAAAKAMGKNVKLFGRAKRFDDKDGISVWTEPVLVAADSPEAAVHSSYNLITFDCKFVGKESFYGRGAGSEPTGYAVAHDCLDIQYHRAGLYNWEMRPTEADNTKYEQIYYLRTDDISAFEGYIAENKSGYCITKPISVSEMHKKAKEIQNSGKDIFFAAIV